MTAPEPITIPADHDEKAIRAIMAKSKIPHAHGDWRTFGVKATLYGVCNGFISWDLDFIDWLLWAEAFAWVALKTEDEGSVVCVVTDMDAWYAYTMQERAP